MSGRERSFLRRPLLSTRCLPLLAAIAVVAVAQPSGTPARIASRATLQPFPPANVRLLPGSPFADALEANKAYLLALDPDRLLAPFRREAGLPPKADLYGNWERTGLAGHTAGHYLSALSTMLVETGDPELSRRLKAMVAELAECQQASPDGYVGGIPGSRELWEKVRAGDAGAVSFRWVPWYNIHKLYAGLRDAWLLTGNPQARDVLIRLADWSGRAGGARRPFLSSRISAATGAPSALSSMASCSPR